LLSQAVQLIPNRFGFYHTGIFLNDAEGKYTILAASNSEGGQRMLRRGHALKIGEVGIVGYVAASGKARIALDVGKDPVFFDNPDLPETRSEIALPIKTSAKMSESESDISTMRTSQILGVLDIQSTKPGAFDEKDLIALQIIADSLAGAIENARLLSEAQDNLEEVKLLHRQYLRRAWGETQERQGKLAYNFQAIPSRPSPEGAQPGLVRSVSVPIRLREQVIGGLTIEAPLPEAPQAAAGSPNIEAGSEWTSEELALIEAVTNQAAQALENARLLEQVQSRAVQEELINRIVASIQGSLNLDTVMRTAVQEIGQALKARRVQIRLGVSGDREGGRPTQPITGEKIQGSLNRETDQ
jgi:GAF domain-containing protein